MAITDPLDIAGCTLWLDFDDTSTLTLSGNEITNAVNQADSSNWIVLFGGSGPDYQAATLNGRGVAIWPGTNRGLRNTSYQMPNPGTYFMVFLLTGDTNASILTFLDNTVVAPLAYHPTAQFYVDTGVAASNKFAIAADTDYYVSVVLDSTASLARLNGAVQFSGIDLGTNIFAASTNLGRRASAEVGFGNEPGSYCGEVIVYDSALSSGDYLDVEDYLYNKWFVVGGGEEAEVVPFRQRVIITS